MFCGSQELVSVVIPTYKRNDTLRRALNSIVAQTYKNIEIIVVDDNAEFPDVRAKNRNLVQEYPDVILVENECNLGGGLSRNAGIQRAKGTFIAFLDDDDEYLPEKIEEQMKLYSELNNPNVAMIYCYANRINVDGSMYQTKGNACGTLLLENITDCIAATSWWFCPKDKLLSVGGFEDISSRQDASLLTKFFLKGYEAYCVPKVLLNYYWHDSNSGISKISQKTLKAEEQYRELFVANSANVEPKLRTQALYAFAYRLAIQHILLRDRKGAFKQLCEMVKLNIRDRRNIRVAIGVVLNRTYCYLSGLKNRKRVGK